jgi:hypothetical protein
MQSLESGIGTARVESAAASRFTRYRASAAVLAVVLVIVGLATAWNLEGWPGRVDDDEGTYVAQAWAILYEHTLTHYSYWYDHPPLGWAQIALFAWVTDGFNRVASAVFVGREFMWCVTLACCALLYVLCRRLAMRRATSAITVLLFGLSPLAQFFHRLVSLDNVETLWVLAALVAAASPRRGLGPACRAGACAAIAVLSKETALILVPVIAWVLWQHTGATAGEPAEPPGDVPAALSSSSPADQATAEPAAATAAAESTRAAPATPAQAAEASATGAGDAAEADVATEAGTTERPVWMPDWSAFASRHSIDLRRVRAPASAPSGLAGVPAAALRALPPRTRRLVAFAVTGCVIAAIYPIYALQRGQLGLLWSTLKWQFFDRPGSGSLLDSGSFTYAVVHGWLITDPWLLVTGLVAALPLVLFSRRLRPFAFALLLQIAVLIKGSYLPYFYVTSMLPFAALAIGGAADTLWARLDLSRLGARAAWRGAPYLGRALVAIVALVYAVHVVPEWVSALGTDSTANGDAPYLAAAAWAEQNVPKGDVVVVDDYLWVDLKRHGLSPLWMWKISPQTTPDGWKSIQYIIEQPQSAGTLAGLPALQGAYAHSVLVKNFGNGLTARRVTDAG